MRKYHRLMHVMEVSTLFHQHSCCTAKMSNTQSPLRTKPAWGYTIVLLSPPTVLDCIPHCSQYHNQGPLVSYEPRPQEEEKVVWLWGYQTLLNIGGVWTLQFGRVVYVPLYSWGAICIPNSRCPFHHRRTTWFERACHGWTTRVARRDSTGSLASSGRPHRDCS